MSFYNKTTSGTPSTNTRLLLCSGTASVPVNGITVTGTSTLFTTDFGIGEVITLGTGDTAETKTIVTIASNTSLTVDVPFVYAQTAQVPIAGSYSQGTVVIVKADATNTGVLFVGESTNTARDGADVTATTKSWSLVAGESTPPMVIKDLKNVFIQGSVASQKYNVIVE